MKIYEYGDRTNPILLFFHAAVTNPAMYEPALKQLSKHYYIIVPEADGHSLTEHTCFTDVCDQVKKVESYLRKKGISRIHGLYGVSMGGAFALRFLANKNISVERAIIDAGITPYCFNKNKIVNGICSRLALLSDIVMILTVRHAPRLVRSCRMSQSYRTETMESMIKVMRHMSLKSAIRVFDGTNNYPMPDRLHNNERQIQYWFGEKEKKERKSNLAFVKKLIPGIQVKEFPNMSHAELILEHPKEACHEIVTFIQ